MFKNLSTWFMNDPLQNDEQVNDQKDELAFQLILMCSSYYRAKNSKTGEGQLEQNLVMSQFLEDLSF